MKKVLFGIMALSMAAFAANPADPANPETASVPVKVIAEIITAPTGLTITDEAGTVLDELVIDHGKIVKGAVSDDSVAFKLFKVQKFNADGTAAALLTDTTNKTKLEAKLTGLANGDVTTLKNVSDITKVLASTLSLSGGSNPINTISYNHTLVDDDKVHTGRVTSRIAKTDLNNSTVGIHHNGDNKPTLTVTLVP